KAARETSKSLHDRPSLMPPNRVREMWHGTKALARPRGDGVEARRFEQEFRLAQHILTIKSRTVIVPQTRASRSRHEQAHDRRHPGHLGHADPEDLESRADARLRHRAAHRANLARRVQGEPRLAAHGAASARAGG